MRQVPSRSLTSMRILGGKSTGSTQSSRNFQVLACSARAGAWDDMILTCCFHNFDLAIVKRSLAPICFKYVTDRLWKVESIALIIIFVIICSSSFAPCNNRLCYLLQGLAIVEHVRLAFSPQQSLNLESFWADNCLNSMGRSGRTDRLNG